MKKDISRSAVLFAVLEIVLFLIFVLQNSKSALFCFIFVILAAALTFAETFAVRNKISVKVTLPTTAEKGKAVCGTVTFENSSNFPILRGICELETENKLTGEKGEELVRFSVAPKEKSVAEFSVASDYCGYVTVKAKKIYVTDVFGFLPTEAKKVNFSKGKITVLPETFMPLIVFGGMLSVPEDSETYSPDKKGNDYSETFQIREYALGDSIKQIHWKLSEKFDKTIVRDASLPIAKNIMLYWEKPSDDVTPAEMDAMAEVTSSIAQSLCKSGYEFMLGWNDGNRNECVRVTSDSDLLEAIPRLIKFRPNVNDDIEKEDMFSHFAKVICVAKKVPEELLEKDGADVLVCDKEAMGKNIISFNEKDYFKDLEFLEFGV